MAWNIPGGSNKDGRNPVRGGAGGVFDRLVDPLRGLFGGGGVVRWIGPPQRLHGVGFCISCCT